MQKAVIDRIEDGKHAVLLIGEDETERVLPVENLPEGVREGVWLILHEDGSIVIDEAGTTQVKSRIQEKMALLRSKQNSKFKKY